MANNVSSGSPLIVDTAAADTIVAAGTRVKVRGIRWVGGTTAGHTAVIQDIANSKVLWSGLATAANQTVESTITQVWTNGFKVPTLGSGILYIYLQEPEA